MFAQTKSIVQEFRPEAVVMVWVLPADKARVAMVIESRLSKQEAQTVLNRLSRLTGWEVAPDLRITQERSRFDHAIQTGIEATLLHAPQMVGTEPAILPYLSVLQNKNRLEVVFMTGTPFVARDLDSAVRPDLTLRRQVLASGTVRFEAEISEHRLPLAPPAFGQVIARPLPKQAPMQEPKTVSHTGTPFFTYLLMAVGLGCLVVGAYVYLGANRTSASPRY